MNYFYVNTIYCSIWLKMLKSPLRLFTSMSKIFAIKVYGSGVAVRKKRVIHKILYTYQSATLWSFTSNHFSEFVTGVHGWSVHFWPKKSSYAVCNIVNNKISRQRSFRVRRIYWTNEHTYEAVGEAGGPHCYRSFHDR